MPVTNLTFDNKVGDMSTPYDVSGGDKLFKKPANRNDSFTIQVIWTGLDAFDGTVTAQGSNDDANYDDLSEPNQIALDSANGSASMQCEKCDAANHAANYIRGAATVGNIIILLNEN